MNIQEGIVEEVDIPPNLSARLSSSRNDVSDSQADEQSNRLVVVTGSVDGLSASSSSLESLNMLLEKQRKRQLNHPQHQEFFSESLRPQESVKETNEIFLKYDPISKRKVLNTYEIINELGHGQHGKVKLARDLLTKRLVAIKIVDRHEKREKNFLRFRKNTALTHSDKIKREIAIMKKCHYKHVVELIEVLDDFKSRKIYLVLEYCSQGEVKWCPGDQMETEARGPPLLTFQRTREILRGVVLGLEYLHYQGVIHRDIKPANLLISEDNTVKISDFGVSLAATGAEDADNIESDDELELAKTAGTPAFFAPEICLGNEAFEKYQLKREDLFKGSSISFMIDIWALGVTLYCLLFGMLPFISDYELELFEKIVNDPVKFPSYEEVKGNRVSMLSSEEEYNMALDLVNRLLEKNPMKRITIAEIKQHPFACWDFDHLASTEDDYIDSKLREVKEFQLDKEEQFKQISISRHELKNAVLGVGKKIRESVFKALPNGLCRSHNAPTSHRGTPEPTISETGTKNNEDSSSDSSYIVSEGSIMSNIGSSEKNSQTANKKNKEIKHTNSNDDKSSTSTIFKKQYNFFNDNDNDNNGNDNGYDKTNHEIHGEVSQSDLFERELQRFDDKHDPKSIVDIPINSSFASLDSLYIDNYAVSRCTAPDEEIGRRDSRTTPTIHVRPPSVGPFHKPQFGARNNRVPGPWRNSSSRVNYLDYGSHSTRSDRVPHTMASPTQGIFNREDGRRKSSKLAKSQNGGEPLSPNQEKKADATDHRPFQKRDVAKEDDPKQFTIKRGNFFSSFNGQDEETSTSSEASISDGSSCSSHSDAESNGSNTDSLPFEFGVDSANASVVSMRDVAGFETVRPFMDVHSTTRRARSGTLEQNESSQSQLEEDSDDSGDSDELVLNIGGSGHSRRQGSAQSSASSSRRGTLPYLTHGRDLDAPTQGPSYATIIPCSASTILPVGDLTSQMSFNVPSNLEGRTLDVPDHLTKPLYMTDYASEDLSSSPSPGPQIARATATTNASLAIPRAKPTTQASNVGGILSKSKHREQSQDRSKDLLRTVLITSAGSNRRKSVPCITVPRTAEPGRTRHRPGLEKSTSSRSTRRQPRSSMRKPFSSGETRSQSISLGELGSDSAH